MTGRTQRVTASDKRAGQIRIPITGMTKNMFPSERTTLRILLKGQEWEAAWDPRHGPDRERSGVLRLKGDAKDHLRQAVRDDEVLTVTEQSALIEIR